MGRRIYKDEDGTPVKAGDVIRFSFGIPPIIVDALVEDRDGKLWALTPDVNPKESTIGQLISNCGLINIMPEGTEPGTYKRGTKVDRSNEIETRAFRASDNEARE
ncbi:MAG: hypothetical protein AAGK02_16055 [Pseudomonadota bacterium]